MMICYDDMILRSGMCLEMTSRGEEQNWINNQIELTARDIQTPEDARAWHEKSKLNLTELIQKHKIPGNLKEYTPDSAIDNRFSSQWQWEEFKKGTFWGDQFKNLEQARSPYSNWTELISLIANTVASTRVMLHQAKL